MQSTETNGACITSLSMITKFDSQGPNVKQVLVGKNDNLPSFWMDQNDQYCLDNLMSSSQITIQNGQVNSSVCKPMGQDGVIYVDPSEEDSK